MDRSRKMVLLQGTGRASKVKTSVEPNGLVGWVLGLLQSSRDRYAAENRQMRLLETLALGGKRQLMLVSCAGEQFLVGGGPESVETIVRVKSEVPPQDLTRHMDEPCQ